jgi:5-methylcytosine-specific restriction endonuclease McrA
MSLSRKRARFCKDCKKETDGSAFYDSMGELNPRGRFCRDCYETREREQARALTESEEAAAGKFRIMFGHWWKHYAYPYAFIFTLYSERDFCPYCGTCLPPLFVNKTSRPPYLDRPHLDHMDPLARGGEDSIRNAVYCCGPCNHAKRNRLFLAWLESLAPQFRELSRQIYIDKHEHDPEEFVPGEPQDRMGGVGIELDQTDDELRAEYPTPIESGPPRSYLARLLANKLKDGG